MVGRKARQPWEQCIFRVDNSYEKCGITTQISQFKIKNIIHCPKLRTFCGKNGVAN
ncbi:hypothetical protein FACS1894198_4380 [Clostridia bacterium]|nr:hypothetical protein FACS1894198_4380 [Clostridia bacterium]